MSKKSDFLGIRKKLKIDGLVGNVKSMISPSGLTPDADEDDELGQHLAELSILLQEMEQTHAKQGKRIANINKLINAVFLEIKSERSELAGEECDDEDEDEDEDKDDEGGGEGSDEKE